jgi:hypothetical protein
VSTKRRAGKKTLQGQSKASRKPPSAGTAGAKSELDDRELDQVSGGTGLSTAVPVTDTSATGTWSHDYEFRAGKWTSTDYQFEVPTKTPTSR